MNVIYYNYFAIYRIILIPTGISLAGSAYRPVLRGPSQFRPVLRTHVPRAGALQLPRARTFTPRPSVAPHLGPPSKVERDIIRLILNNYVEGIFGCFFVLQFAFPMC